MRIVFMGTPEFSLNILQALIDSSHHIVGVVTQPDRKVGRKQTITPPPIKSLALKYHIPVFQPEQINRNYEQIIKWKPELIITCAYGQIIPKQLLKCPKFGAINVHASLLPNYRGGAPIHKAILDGCSKTGITIMYMSEKMDEGDIIVQQVVEIIKKDNVLTLHNKLSHVGADLLMATLPSIFNGTNKRIKQDESKASYAYNITREQEKINWNLPGEQIYNRIRGLNPWPGAYAVINNKRVKIYQAEEVVQVHNKQGGEIIRLYKDAILVTSGNEVCLKITEVQLEGKKPQKMNEVLNGKNPFVLENKFE